MNRCKGVADPGNTSPNLYWNHDSSTQEYQTPENQTPWPEAYGASENHWLLHRRPAMHAITTARDALRSIQQYESDVVSETPIVLPSASCLLYQSESIAHVPVQIGVPAIRDDNAVGNEFIHRLPEGALDVLTVPTSLVEFNGHRRIRQNGFHATHLPASIHRKEMTNFVTSGRQEPGQFGRVNNAASRRRPIKQQTENRNTGSAVLRCWFNGAMCQEQFGVRIQKSAIENVGSA